MLSIRKRFPYVYETHMHTKESSACARSYAKDMVKAYQEYGYTGVILTDHNWNGNTAVSRSLPWTEWVQQFCKGYENAKAEGDRIGLQVFFGYEANYSGTEFLIYGTDPKWLSEHPKIKDATIEEQYKMIHEIHGLVIHAHPFREEAYIPEVRLYPEWVDGVEGINAAHSCSRSTAHNDPEFDHKAIEYARKHRFPMTAGSDMHKTNLLGGGVAFSRKLTSIQDFIQVILSEEEYLLTDGDRWYCRDGSVYTEE